eukprot:5161335-Amphidinium_carterae.5
MAQLHQHVLLGAILLPLHQLAEPVCIATVSYTCATPRLATQLQDTSSTSLSWECCGLALTERKHFCNTAKYECAKDLYCVTVSLPLDGGPTKRREWANVLASRTLTGRDTPGCLRTFATFAVPDLVASFLAVISGRWSRLALVRLPKCV